MSQWEHVEAAASNRYTHSSFVSTSSRELSLEEHYSLSNSRNRNREPSRATMSDRKAVIKNADMSEDMQQDAVECATQALEKYNIEKDIAAYIKKEFDKKYNPTWHCIVGRNFGSYVTHETKHFIYFYLGQVAILLFKSG
ncbi:dynein light chain 1, cytoplasmic [Solea solea]|uniref:dynein light chain 1, cytoplasmic n=1 Tax=Solea solea TaxID=90069 RepID=UPI00272AFF8C|nr:dynein light chain 1, cytoplasmic [Solea solea]